MSKQKSNNRYVRNLLCIQYGKYCMICNRRFTKKRKATYHHIKKLIDGGEASIENGGVLCECCHTKLHLNAKNEEHYNKVITEYKRRKDMHNRR